MPVYFTLGKRPAEPVLGTDECSKCLPIIAHTAFPDLVYDTEGDAKTTWNSFGQVLLNRSFPNMWTRLWNDFQCTGDACRRKQACADVPTFVEAGSLPVMDPVTKEKRWQLYVTIAREIRCVATGGGADVKPKIPKYVPSDKPGDHPIPKVPRPDDLFPKPWQQKRVQNVRARDLFAEPGASPKPTRPKRKSTRR